jgi:predicted transcriptional regulator
MMEIAAGGPCAGHPCDDCWHCQRGTCCRRDLPDYQLPELGDWEGVVHGELGVLLEEGDWVQCHACGKYYKALISHIFAKRGLLAAEYKSLFGLNQTPGLTSSETSSKIGDHAQALVAAGKIGPGTLWSGSVISFTPEQRSAHLRGRKPSLQAAKNNWAAARRRGTDLEARKFSVAVAGDCAGHLCDDCGVCQGGTCCGRDRPDYQLPELGDWDGPFHGELGVLLEEEGKVQCHTCGNFFKSLGTHIRIQHDLLGDEYRALFGLNQGCGLVCGETAGRFREMVKDLIAKGRTGDVRKVSVPPGQMAALHRERKHSLQERRNRSTARREMLRRMFADPEEAADYMAPIHDGFRRWVQTITPEEKAEVVRKQQASREASGGAAAIGEAARQWWQNATPEQKAEKERKRRASLAARTPEQKAERLWKWRASREAAGWRVPSEAEQAALVERTRAWWREATPEQKAERNRKRLASREASRLKHQSSANAGPAKG